MAPAPETRRGGLDLANPGAKEFVIVGGIALGAALLYFWWKGRHAPAAAAASAGGGAPATVTGLSTSAFSAWIRDHQSSPRRRRETDRREEREERDRDGAA